MCEQFDKPQWKFCPDCGAPLQKASDWWQCSADSFHIKIWTTKDCDEGSDCSQAIEFQ
jgi:hypothetical protein